MCHFSMISFYNQRILINLENVTKKQPKMISNDFYHNLFFIVRNVKKLKLVNGNFKIIFTQHPQIKWLGLK